MDIRVQKGDTVTVHYQLCFQNGKVFDNSLGDGPVSFVLGNGFVIQGLEDAVLGMELGEKKTVTLPPYKAYGSKEKELLLTIPRSSVPDHIEIEDGKRVEIQTEDGAETKLTICDVTADTVTLDGNPEQTGQYIVLSVEVVSIS
jgi:FKBP-type peptidyl-prolyl cis-trans isomerase 2